MHSHSQARVMESAARDLSTSQLFLLPLSDRAEIRGILSRHAKNQAKQTSQNQLECAGSFLPSLSPPRAPQGGLERGIHGMQGKALPANQQLRLGLPWGREQPSQHSTSPIPAELLHGQGAASQSRLHVTSRGDSELRKGKRSSWQRG